MEATTSTHQRASVASQPERVDLDRHQGRVLRQLSRWTGRLERRVAELARVGVVPPAVTCPVGATSVTPAVNLVAAVQAAGVGASLCLKPGVYRLSGQVRPLAGQTITLERGAIVSGAKVVTCLDERGHVLGPRQADAGLQLRLGLGGASVQRQSDRLHLRGPVPRWTAPATGEEPCRGRPAGEVFFDKARDKMYIVDDPTGHAMEATTVTTGIASGATGVTIRGASSRRWAGSGYRRMVARWTIENSEIRYAHGTGLRSDRQRSRRAEATSSITTATRGSWRPPDPGCSSWGTSWRSTTTSTSGPSLFPTRRGSEVPEHVERHVARQLQP